MNKKLTVGLVFGGRSGEHEVSLQSAKSIYEALDKEKYNVLLIGVDKLGQWRLGEGSQFLLDATNPKLIKLNDASPIVTPVADTKDTHLLRMDTQQAAGAIDVFFPIIHGTYGEDGSLQGLFELLNAPYVGAGVLGSAVGMDKDVMKRLLQAAGLSVAPFLALRRGEFDLEAEVRAIEKTFDYPVFIKPANMGSSVGISKVHTQAELRQALQEAWRYDTKILCEGFVAGRELEFAVLGNRNPQVSLPGEVRPRHEFYSYEAKYIDENGAELIIPAAISKDLIKAGQELAKKAFQTLECSGMGRVDFFLQPDGAFVVNEINTLPGFTKISMYPKLWEASGVGYSQLLDMLIGLALERFQEKNGLKRTFEA